MSETLIKFHCPHCDHKIEAEARLGGENFPCPSCGKRLVIPARTIGPGIVLGGYRLERLLGKGGMGEVYLAKQVAMDRQVAVKVLDPKLVQDREYVGRFMNEVRLLARLDHPNIVTAIDAGQEGGTYYLAMTYVNGRPMALRLEQGEFIPENEAILIGLKIATALSYAWEKHQLLHRDVKPSNILIDEHGEPKLTDLGVSKSAGDADNSLTVTGMVVGTPYYMSPEQARGDGPLDFRADLYSLGATLFHMITGRVPFDGDTSMAIISKVLTDPLPNPKAYNPQVTYGTSQVLRAMTEKAKEDRYADWGDLIQDLKLISRGKPPRHAPRLMRQAKARRRAAPPATTEGGIGPITATAPRSTQGLGLLVAITCALLVAAGTLVTLILQQPPAVDADDAAGVTLTGGPLRDPVLPNFPRTDTVAVPTPPPPSQDTRTADPLPEVVVTPADPAAVPTPPPPSQDTRTADPLPEVVVTPADPVPPPLSPEAIAAAERDRQLTEMMTFADDFAVEHPDDFDTAIAMYREVANAGAGTVWVLRVNERIGELEVQRHDAIAAVLAQLREQAQPLVDDQRYDEAIDVYRNYVGRFADLTAEPRREAERELQRQRRILERREETARAEAELRLAADRAAADTAYQELVTSIALDLANLSMKDVAAKIVTMRRNPLEIHIRPKVNALSDACTQIEGLYERIRENLRGDGETPVTLKLKDRDITGVVTTVTATDIKVRVSVTIDGRPAGTVERTVKLSDLTLAERIRLLGPDSDATVQIMRAVLCLSAKEPEKAETYLALADSDLGRALLSELQARRQNAAGEDARRELRTLLRYCRLNREEGMTQEDVLTQLRAQTYTRTEVDAIRKAAADYIRRHPDSEVLRENDQILRALAELQYIVWPSPTPDALVFLWEHALAQNKVPDGRGVGVLRCEVLPEGKARIDDSRRMNLDGGIFRTGDLGSGIVKALKKSNAFTIELTISPAAGDQTGPARILSLSDGAMSRDLSLCQEGRRLILRLRTTKTGENGLPELPLTVLDGDGPFHVVVTYQDGDTRCYVNGRQELRSDQITGTLEPWTPMALVFGNEISLDRPWRGSIWGVVLQARALSAEEAEGQYEMFRKQQEQH